MSVNQTDRALAIANKLIARYIEVEDLSDSIAPSATARRIEALELGTIGAPHNLCTLRDEIAAALLQSATNGRPSLPWATATKPSTRGRRVR